MPGQAACLRWKKLALVSAPHVACPSRRRRLDADGQHRRGHAGAPALIHGERTTFVRRPARPGGARRPRPRRSRRRPGRSRRTLAAQPAGLSDSLLRLRAAGRRRRRGEHALSRRRSRRHRQPLGRQGVGLRAGLPRHRLPGDPGRRRASRARQARRVVVVGDEPPAVPPAIERLRRVPFQSLLSRPALGASHARASAPCNIFTTSGTTSAPKFVLIARAQSPATPSRWRAPSHSMRRRPCRSRSCRCAACSASTRRLRRSPPAALRAGRVLRDRGDRAADRPSPPDDDVRQRRHVRPPARAGAGRPAVPSIKWAGYAAFNASLENLPERAETRGLSLVGLYGMSEVQALYARPAARRAGRRDARRAAGCRSRRWPMCACATRRAASCRPGQPGRSNAPARR